MPRVSRRGSHPTVTRAEPYSSIRSGTRWLLRAHSQLGTVACISVSSAPFPTGKRRIGGWESRAGESSVHIGHPRMVFARFELGNISLAEQRRGDSVRTAELYHEHGSTLAEAPRLFCGGTGGGWRLRGGPGTKERDRRCRPSRSRSGSVEPLLLPADDCPPNGSLSCLVT